MRMSTFFAVLEAIKGVGGSTYGLSWKLILYCFLKEESEIYHVSAAFYFIKNIDPRQSYCWLKVSAYEYF